MKSSGIWECTSCFEFYDTKIQDVPLIDIKKFKVKSYGTQHYPTYDESDPEQPFIEGIDLDSVISQEDDEWMERRYEDQRIQHINLHNVTFADAILKGALSSKKQKKNDE